MSFHQAQEDEVMSEINMTPLVDIMLVLLIIFIITIPAINHAVKLELPVISHQVNDTKPPHVDIAIDVTGAVSWNAELVQPQVLADKIAEAAKQQPQPEIHLRADHKTAYENVVKVMVAAQTGGLSKIGFITEPATP